MKVVLMVVMMSLANVKALITRLKRPAVMGVLNVTPDSFSDGGQFNQLDAAFEHAITMIEDGADIIDIGGESTRPGATPVTPEQELARVLPVVKAIRQHSDVPITIDTSQPLVIIETIKAGANMINDVRAMQVPGAIKAVVETNASVIMYHMLGTPKSIKFVDKARPDTAEQFEPHYEHVVHDIKHFFKQRIDDCIAAGILRDNMAIDPGFCFGKTYQHNMQLLANLKAFKEFDIPLCVGMSRKSFIGRATGRDVNDRLYGSIATSILAAQQGADIIRVHDVKPTIDALNLVSAVEHEGVLA